MMSPLWQPEVLVALGLDSMSSGDRLSFLTEHGDKIFAAALNEFESTISAPEQENLQAYLATDPGTGNIDSAFGH